jgi:hypothetical protein
LPLLQIPSALLLLNPNHADRNRPPFPLRKFQTRPLRLLFRLERFRLRRHLTIDVSEEQPLLDNFQQKFIARAERVGLLRASLCSLLKSPEEFSVFVFLNSLAKRYIRTVKTDHGVYCSVDWPFKRSWCVESIEISCFQLFRFKKESEGKSSGCLRCHFQIL